MVAYDKRMVEYTSPHPEEEHRSHRSAWLRAAVLGVNDGIVSVAGLMLGVLAASAGDSAILAAGFAGLTAGALSMALGEYVSVSSQRDAEKADLEIEKRSLINNPEEELAELIFIYEQRGLDTELARQVAQQLHDHDALAAHARDEHGINPAVLPRPLQAAVASASAFALGAVVPIVAALLGGGHGNSTPIVISSLLALGISGAIGAQIGGGHKLIAASRVFLGGGAAMGLTALIGHLVGRSIV
jgi:VIT1/CCC1 family predicted Fe2+/Mn2+ transporter